MRSAPCNSYHKKEIMIHSPIRKNRAVFIPDVRRPNMTAQNSADCRGPHVSRCPEVRQAAHVCCLHWGFHTVLGTVFIFWGYYLRWFSPVCLFPRIWIQNSPVCSAVRLCIESICGAFARKRRDIQMDVSSFSVADMGFEPFNCKCPVDSCWPGSVPTTPYDVFPTGNPSTPNSIIHSIKNRYLWGSVPLFSWKETNLDQSDCRHPGGNYRWYALQHTGRNSQIIILFYSVCMLFILFFYFSSAYQIIKNKVHFLYSVCPAETFACVANISRICIIIYNKYVRMIR